ncbi:MAG: VWA domain-containing protein [Ignavibacteriae bacterium]|nr:VWA domain-containing protein [Ignavibacteriota bacterium]
MLFLVALCLLACSAVSFAQPVLSLRGLGLNWPSIRIDFSVKCKGVWTHAFDKTRFRVFEDSVDMGEFELRCPDGTARCGVVAALVLDASGSMGGEKNMYARIAAGNFIENMDGVQDRAAVIWFQSRDTLVQPLTSDKLLLKAAVDSLPAAGTTAVWDATWKAITELVNNGSGYDTCGAVIVLTDGNDNASVRTLGEVAAYAVSRRMRVITVGIGADVNDVALNYLATATGGVFHHVQNADQLPGVYEDIFMDVAGIEACEIVYRSACADGTLRTVELRIENFCGGSDRKTWTFRAPVDGAPAIPIEVQPRGGTVKEGDTLVVPVDLLTPLAQAPFPVSEVTIRYDTTLLRYVGIASREGCLLKNAELVSTTLGDAVIVNTRKKVMVEGSGTMFRLAFVGREQDQTRCAPLSVNAWTFTAGCLAARTGSAEICVETKRPSVRCTIDAPAVLVWDASLRRYSPDTVTLVAHYTNTGEKVLRSARFLLEAAPDAFEILSPASLTQMLPGGDLAVGDTATIRWLVRALPRASLDSLALCVRGQFGNHPDIVCCTRVIVPDADAGIRCSVSAPVLVADTVRRRYDPTPTSVVVTVRNEGGRDTDTIRVVLELPASITPYTTVDHPVGLLTPPVLRRGESGVFIMRARIAAEPRGATLRFFSRAIQGRDTSVCATNLDVPPLHAPKLFPSCEVPLALPVDSMRGVYMSDTFDVTLSLVNPGDRTATRIVALLLPPPGVVLADAAQTLRRNAVPASLTPRSTGGGEARITWRVAYTRRPTDTTALQFGWMVWGEDAYGAPTDTAYTSCSTIAPPLPERLRCTLASSVTDFVMDSGTVSIDPAQFLLTARLANGTAQPLRDVRVTVRPTAAGGSDPFEADPAAGDTSATRTIPILFPGESRECVWNLRTRSSFLSPAATSVEYTLDISVDGQVSDFGKCATQIVIRGSDGRAPQLSCSLTVPDTVRYDDTGYVPLPIPVQVRLRNTGGAIARSTHVYLLQGALFTAASPADIAVGDLPGGSEMDSTLSPRFLLVPQAVDTPTIDTVRVLVVSPDAAPAYCSAVLVVQRRRVPRLQLVCAVSPDTARTGRGTAGSGPDTVRVTATLVNTGDAPAYDCRLTASAGGHLLPLDAVSPRQTPMLLPNARVTFTWFFAPLDGEGIVTDTIRIGAIARDLPATHTTDDWCTAAVTLERGVASVLKLACSAPDTIPTGRSTSISFRAAVRNESSVSATGGTLRLVLPPYTRLDAGETADKPVPVLPPGGQSEAVWRLITDFPSVSGDTRICATVQTDRNDGLSCCATPRLLPAGSDGLETGCEAPDSLQLDAQRAQYLPAQFETCLEIRNTGPDTLDSGEVRIVLPTSGLERLSPAADTVAFVLAPGAAKRFCWTLRAVPQPRARFERLLLVVSRGGSTLAECERRIGVPATDAVAIGAVLATHPADTLHFNWTVDDFEGEASPTGSHTVFRVEGTVDGRQARGVTALLLPPDGITFDEGESAEKQADSAVLAQGLQDHIVWRMRAARAAEGATRTFVMSVRATNAHETRAETSLFVQGAPRTALLTLPRDVNARRGQRIVVPVSIDASRVGAISSYAVNITFDPALLAFAGLRQQGTLTADGWRGARVQLTVPTDPTRPAVLSLRDTALTLPIPRLRTGVFAELLFDAVYDGGVNGLDIAAADLRFLDTTTTAGESFTAGVNGSGYRAASELRLEYEHGRVLLTGDCLVPVRSAAEAEPLLAAPNPFTTSTRIDFRITRRGPIRLDILDALGRPVHMAVEGVYDAGRHRIVFDAGTLPGGMYRCRLAGPDGIHETAVLLIR